MNKHLFAASFLTSVVLFSFAGVASAHQPLIVSGTQVAVTDPQISKAYYGKLSDEPHVYTITATEPFNLYVNILVPDIAGQKKDVSVAITKYGAADRPLAVFDGPTSNWDKYFENYGHDNYWRGPEYRVRADAGKYEILVWSSNNDSKYTLAIGETEAFGFQNSLSALTIIPQIKSSFFGESPINFIFSPFGWGLLVTMYILAVIFGIVYRMLLKYFARNSVRGLSQNIGKPDRILRLAIGIVLLMWAITTTWSPVLLFFSGFCLFEAAFSWCGFYAALGKTTCPIM